MFPLIGVFLALGVDVDKFGLETDAHFLGLLSLDAHDFLNGFDDVEWGGVLPELTCFDLGLIKKILDNEFHEIG